MASRKLLSAFLLVMPCCLLASCGGGAPVRDGGITAEYRAFLDARGADGPADAQDGPDGSRFELEGGRLRVVGADGAERWRSEDGWYVDSFRIGDVNRDQALDVAFVVWKSYSFGAEHPARMANDDAAVRCHLFVYSLKDGRAKPLWCSSSLPRPIYSFELRDDGEQTPTLSGTRLLAQEGAYTEDYSETAATERAYAWDGWGFSPEQATGADGS